MSKNLRQEMPEITALIDSLRTAFGADFINAQIRAGMKGQPTFYAYENGHEIGTRDTGSTSAIRYDVRGLPYSAEPDWMTDARQYAIKRGLTIRPADKSNARDLEREITELRKVIAMGKPWPTSKGTGE